jgi:hypothetical protein
MIKTVSIRLALRKFAKLTCGTAPTLILVKAHGEGTARSYAASIPWEYREEIFAYLEQHLNMELRIEGAVLYLSQEQASAVLALARTQMLDEPARNFIEPLDLT